jgi:hypothetical protein
MLLIELSLTIVAKALAHASFHTYGPRADEMSPSRSERESTSGCTASQHFGISHWNQHGYVILESTIPPQEEAWSSETPGFTV